VLSLVVPHAFSARFADNNDFFFNLCIDVPRAVAGCGIKVECCNIVALK
jgi:hypothetical protein